MEGSGCFTHMGTCAHQATYWCVRLEGFMSAHSSCSHRGPHKITKFRQFQGLWVNAFKLRTMIHRAGFRWPLSFLRFVSFIFNTLPQPFYLFSPLWKSPFSLLLRPFVFILSFFLSLPCASFFPPFFDSSLLIISLQRLQHIITLFVERLHLQTISLYLNCENWFPKRLVFDI